MVMMVVCGMEKIAGFLKKLKTLNILLGGGAVLLSFLTSFASAQTYPISGPAGEAFYELRPERDWRYGANDFCSRFPHPPGLEISDRDKETEKRLCSYDFSAGNILTCPKTWSTSPATMIYQVDFAGLGVYRDRFSEAPIDREEFKKHSWCYRKRPFDSKEFVDKVAKFKYSVAGVKTSALYSNMITAYYHVSRLLKTQIKVPATVYRSTEMGLHLREVTSLGRKKTSLEDLIGQGWFTVQSMEEQAISETNKGHFLNRQNAQHNHFVSWPMYIDKRGGLHGVLVDDKGDRYGALINGQTYSGNKEKRYQGFINGPILKDLRGEATDQYISVSDYQFSRWRRDLTEIAILDVIFRQQDRPWNIDFKWHWFWKKSGKIKSKKANLTFFEYDAASNMHYDQNQRKAMIAVKNTIVQQYLKTYISRGKFIRESKFLDIFDEKPEDSERFVLISYEEIKSVVEAVAAKNTPLRLLQHFKFIESPDQWKELIPPKSVLMAIIEKVNHYIDLDMYRYSELLSHPELVQVLPIQVTYLNDNDAGMLERKGGIRIGDPKSYQEIPLFKTLMQLTSVDYDLKQRLNSLEIELSDPSSYMSLHFRSELGLSQKQFDRMVKNVSVVNSIIKLKPNAPKAVLRSSMSRF